MVRIPDKIMAVMDAIVPHLAGAVVEGAKEMGYRSVWVGGWRGAPCMLSPEMWDRFAWPYFRGLVEEVVDSGLIALLHLDSSWDRELERFLELPRGRCIMATDGTTDLFRAKELLGGHMCLMGDVPASLLCQGSPEEVYGYCTRLIEGLGPDGFILQSGCDIPTDAKLRNVQAMVRAATGK
jgi:uroporphyrinogen-III decarboxylase